jgi:hypothetical protein
MTHLLAANEVFFTKALCSSLRSKVLGELSTLARALGAEEVSKSSPSKKYITETYDLSELVVIGTSGDPELSKLVRLGLNVYSKDFLTSAALRGKFDHQEFALALAVKEEIE